MSSMSYRLVFAALTMSLLTLLLLSSFSSAKLITVKGGCYDVEHLETFQVQSEVENEAVADLLQTNHLTLAGIGGYVQNGEIFRTDGTPLTWRPDHFVNFPTNALGFLVVRENGEWDYLPFNVLPSTWFVCTDDNNNNNNTHDDDETTSSSTSESPSSSSSSSTSSTQTAEPTLTSTTSTTTPEPHKEVNLTELLHDIHCEFISFFHESIEVATFTTNDLAFPLSQTLTLQVQQSIEEGHVIYINFTNCAEHKINSRCIATSSSLTLTHSGNGNVSALFSFVIPFDIVSNQNSENTHQLEWTTYNLILTADIAAHMRPPYSNSKLHKMLESDKNDDGNTKKQVVLPMKVQLRVYTIAYLLKNLNGSIEVTDADLAAQDLRVKSLPIMGKATVAPHTTSMALTAWRSLSFTIVNNGVIGHSCVPAPGSSAAIRYFITDTRVQLLIPAHSLQRVRTGRHSLCASWNDSRVVIATLNRRYSTASTPVHSTFTYNDIIPVTFHDVPLLELANGEYRAFIASSSACYGGQEIMVELVNDYNTGTQAQLASTTVAADAANYSTWPHVLLTAQLQPETSKHSMLTTRTNSGTASFSSEYPKRYVCIQHTTDGSVIPVTHNGKPITVEGNAKSLLEEKERLHVLTSKAKKTLHQEEEEQEKHEKETNKLQHTLVLFAQMQGHVNLSSYIQPPIAGNASDEANYRCIISLLHFSQIAFDVNVDNKNNNTNNKNIDNVNLKKTSQNDVHLPFVRVVPFRKPTTSSSSLSSSSLSLQTERDACEFGTEEVTLPLTNGSLLTFEQPISLFASKGVLCIDDVYLRVHYTYRNVSSEVYAIAGHDTPNIINLIDYSEQSHVASIQFRNTEFAKISSLTILLSPVTEFQESSSEEYEQQKEEEREFYNCDHSVNSKSKLISACGDGTSENHILAPLRFINSNSTVAFFTLPHLVNTQITPHSTSSNISSLQYRVCVGLHISALHTSYFAPLSHRIHLYTFNDGLEEWKRRAKLNESTWIPCDANALCGAAHSAHAIRVCKTHNTPTHAPNSLISPFCETSYFSSSPHSAIMTSDMTSKNDEDINEDAPLPRWSALFYSQLRSMGALHIHMTGNAAVVAADLFDEYYQDSLDGNSFANKEEEQEKENGVGVSEPELYIRHTDALPHCQHLKTLLMTTETITDLNSSINNNINKANIKPYHFAVATLHNPRVMFTSFLPSEGVMLSLIPWNASCSATNFVYTTLTTTIFNNRSITRKSNKEGVVIDLMHLFTSHHSSDNYYGYYALCYWPYVKTPKPKNWLRVGQTGIHVARSAIDYATQNNNSFVEENVLMVDGIVSPSVSLDEERSIRLWETQIATWHLIGVFDTNMSTMLFHFIDHNLFCESIALQTSELVMKNNQVLLTAPIKVKSSTTAIVEIDTDLIFSHSTERVTEAKNLGTADEEFEAYRTCYSTSSSSHLHSLTFEQLENRLIEKRQLTLRSINYLPYFAISNNVRNSQYSVANYNSNNNKYTIFASDDNDNDDDDVIRLQLTDPHHPPITALRVFVSSNTNSIVYKSETDNDSVNSNAEIDCELTNVNYVITLPVYEDDAQVRWCNLSNKFVQRFAHADRVTLRLCATATDVNDGDVTNRVLFPSLFAITHETMHWRTAPHFVPVSAYLIITRQSPETVLNYIALVLHVIPLNSSGDSLSTSVAQMALQSYVMCVVPEVQKEQILVTRVDVNSFSLYIQPSALSLVKIKNEYMASSNHNKITSSNYINWELQTNQEDNRSSLDQYTRQIYYALHKGMHLPLFISNNAENTSIFVLSTVVGVDVRHGDSLDELPLRYLITQTTNETSDTDAMATSIRLFCVVIVPTALGFVAFSIQRTIPTLSNKEDSDASESPSNTPNNVTSTIVIENNFAETEYSNNHNSNNNNNNNNKSNSYTSNDNTGPVYIEDNSLRARNFHKGDELHLTQKDVVGVISQAQQLQFASGQAQSKLSSYHPDNLQVNMDYNNYNDEDDEDEDEDEDMQLTAPPQLAFTAPSDNTKTLDVLTQLVPLLSENVVNSPLYKSFTPNQSDNTTTTITTNYDDDSINTVNRDNNKTTEKSAKDMDNKIGFNNSNYSNNNSNETNVKTNSINRSKYETMNNDWIDNKQEKEKNVLFTVLAASPPVHNSSFAEESDLQNCSPTST